MTDLDDQPILRRLAAIEGYDDYSETQDGLWLAVYRHPNEPMLWNPLKSDAQAFELLVKYGLQIQCSFNGGCPDKGIYGWAVRRQDGMKWQSSRTSLNRAVAKAILAAKEAP